MPLRLIDLSDLAPSAPPPFSVNAQTNIYIASPLRFTRAVPGVCNERRNKRYAEGDNLEYLCLLKYPELYEYTKIK